MGVGVKIWEAVAGALLILILTALALCLIARGQKLEKRIERLEQSVTNSIAAQPVRSAMNRLELATAENGYLNGFLDGMKFLHMKNDLTTVEEAKALMEKMRTNYIATRPSRPIQ